MTGKPSSTELEKWKYLLEAPAKDAQDPELRAIAGALWIACMCRLDAYVLLAAALARDCIRYQTDTARVGGEDIAGYTRPERGPLEALQRGTDDCDAKARLFVALCLARDIPAQMVPLWKGPELAHVNAKVMLAGRWLPVELTLARARVGDDWRDVPFEKGKHDWKRT